MKIFVTVLILASLGSGCSSKEESKKEEPAMTDNAMTRYVGNLQMDVQRAHMAAEKAERANQKIEAAVRQGEIQGE
jgi:outer membrane murein-binding lipoprotein Lpp